MKKLLIILSLVVVALAVVSCGNDNEDEPNYTNQSLVVGQTYAIPGGSTGWKSDNELIASVSSNVVKAEHVGETTIRNGAKSFKVTVKGMYNTYKEPCMQWGASTSTVKSFMSGYTLSSEQSDFLIYNGRSPVSLIAYSFKYGGLTLSSLVIPIGAVSIDELVAFMAERYLYVTQDEANNYFGFITADKKSIVILQIETINSQLAYFISYATATYSSAAPAQTLMRLKKNSTADNENRTEVKMVVSRLLDLMPEMRPEHNIIRQ